jgi:hypothetical protein
MLPQRLLPLKVALLLENGGEGDDVRQFNASRNRQLRE